MRAKEVVKLLEEESTQNLDKPERSLVSALFMRAYADIVCTHIDPHHTRGAIEWILSDSKREYSFLTLVDLMGYGDGFINIMRAVARDTTKHNKISIITRPRERNVGSKED